MEKNLNNDLNNIVEYSPDDVELISEFSEMRGDGIKDYFELKGNGFCEPNGNGISMLNNNNEFDIEKLMEKPIFLQNL